MKDTKKPNTETTPHPLKIDETPKGSSQKVIHPTTLLSDPGDKIQEATAQECVNHLRKLAEADTTKIISRNWFRLNSNLSERAWSKHFGTFHEYKRQAGIVLTRQQHQLEKETAKHASVDHYRDLNIERAKYAESYLKPSGNRFKIIMGVTDVHDKDADPFALRVMLDTAKRIKPDVICFGGDLFDLPEFGRFTQDPREWDVVSRIKFVHEQILKPLRESCPDSQIDLIEGNHCLRLLRHLADSTPAMRAVLSDLHGMTLSKLLGLDTYQVNYIARGDLAAYTSKDIKNEVARNHKIYFDSVLVHHYPEGRGLGIPGFCGHHHKLNTWPLKSGIFGSYNFYQIGGLHRRAATYCDGENWSNGFMLSHVDTQTKSTCFEYVDIRDFCVVGGRYYFRGPSEI